MGKRQIPLSIKIIGALFLIDASLKLATMKLGSEIVLGFPVVGPFASCFKIIYAVVFTFVGSGLWKLRNVARQIGVWLQAYRIIDQLALLIFMFANWNPNASKYPPLLSALALASLCIVPALIQGVILMFLLRRKSFFKT